MLVFLAGKLHPSLILKCSLTVWKKGAPRIWCYVQPYGSCVSCRLRCQLPLTLRTQTTHRCAKSDVPLYPPVETVTVKGLGIASWMGAACWQWNVLLSVRFVSWRLCMTEWQCDAADSSLWCLQDEDWWLWQKGCTLSLGSWQMKEPLSGREKTLTEMSLEPGRDFQGAQWGRLCRIVESLRLEKTSKIIKSNHQPNTTMPTKPCPEVPYLNVFFNTSRDGDATTSLGSLFQCFTSLSVKKFFLISNLNLLDADWGPCLSSYG